VDKYKQIISSRNNLVQAFRYAESFGYERPYVVEIKPLTRTIKQNDLMWSLLTEISEQVIWHGQKLSKEGWKDVLTAALKNQSVVPGINGGFVVLGQSTSKMTVAEMIDVIELSYAFGAQNGVKFKDEQMQTMPKASK
jgi:hypothetical protein